MKRKLSMTFIIILTVSSLTACANEVDTKLVDVTPRVEVSAPITEVALIEEETLIVEVSAPIIEVTPIEEETSGVVVSAPVVATTSNIEYTFHETELVPTKKVPTHMVEFFPADEYGNLSDGFYAVFTTISYKNLSAESQTFMTNSTTIRDLESNEPSSLIYEMRYFSEMDSNKKLAMQYTLTPYQEITFDVAFCISEAFYPIDNPKVFVINPDGTNPINENARVIPIILK